MPETTLIIDSPRKTQKEVMPETTKTYADRLTKSSAVFFIPSGAFYFTAFNAAS